MIDWLSQPPVSVVQPQILNEPPVSRSARRPDVTVRPLDPQSQIVGLLGPQTTGLPLDLWQGSDPSALTQRLSRVQAGDIPALQSLLLTLLLAESYPPDDFSGAEALLLARVDLLRDLGAVEPAHALIEQAGPDSSPARFARWFETALLTGHEERACQVLNARPDLSGRLDARLFCAARAGNWADAALIFDTAKALGALPEDLLAVLDRFLNPDLFEEAAPLPAPAQPDALRFRLHESLGEPLPTATLPLKFASADLRDLAGWKAQIDAAERLSRAGALPPNQLLGIYDARLPAASGGVWDRVEALQRFETALNARNPDALARALPKVWQEMQNAGLQAAFADLFGEALMQQPWRNPQAQELAWRIALLAPSYETHATKAPPKAQNAAFLSGLAQGAPTRGETPLHSAIQRAFAAPPELSAAQQRQLAEHQLGDLLLEALSQVSAGADGDLGALTRGLQSLRAVGLEDLARRAALYLVLAGDQST